MTDRRAGDSSSHAHKRKADEFARLHKRLDDNDALVAELMKARYESVRLHTETTQSLKSLTEAIERLTAGTAGLREMEGDVQGMMRLMSRFNGVLSLLWKPFLFIAVLGGTIYLWAKGLCCGVSQ